MKIESDNLFSSYGSYSPSAFFSKTNFSIEELKLGAPGSSTFKDYWYIWGTTLHEWCHHLQIVGTTFGRRYYFQINTTGIAIAHAIQNFIKKNKNIEVPFGRNKEIYCDEDFLLGLQMDFITKSLMGVQGKINHEKGFFKKHGLKNVSPPKTTISPTIRHKNTNYQIGALHIMEGHACANELWYLMYNAGLSVKKTWKIFEKAHPFLPYKLLLQYTNDILGLKPFDFDIFRILCDVSLNPNNLPNTARGNEDLFWEDFHPGWRFLRALKYVKKQYNLRSILKYNDTNKLYRELKEIYADICNNFNWLQAREIFQNSTWWPNWYITDVIASRKNNPISFALVMENFPMMAKKFPLSFDRYRPRNPELHLGKKLGLNPETEFEGICQLLIICEKTNKEILLRDNVTCPWHNIQFPPAEKCKVKCLFPGFFDSLYGITLEEYASIAKLNSS